MQTPLRNLKIRIFADGADLASIRTLQANPHITGFTTNPTLMRKAGVRNYAQFARELVALVGDRPISFEVLADDFATMEHQAHTISSWGQNVFVKIPVSNSLAEPSYNLISKLAKAGIKQNVTAVLTSDQVKHVSDALADGPECYISVFAGRIADTGVDPVSIISDACKTIAAHEQIGILWASPRELLNLFQAEAAGCRAITFTPDLLKKLDLIGKSLEQYSLETVKMFLDDARASNFKLELENSTMLDQLDFAQLKLLRKVG